MDPFKSITDKIEEIKDEVQRRVEIAILRETTKFNLSRLATLDPKNADKYTGIVDLL
jgi:hypothetical protein